MVQRRLDRGETKRADFMSLILKFSEGVGVGDVRGMSLGEMKAATVDVITAGSEVGPRFLSHRE